MKGQNVKKRARNGGNEHTRVFSAYFRQDVDRRSQQAHITFRINQHIPKNTREGMQPLRNINNNTIDDS